MKTKALLLIALTALLLAAGCDSPDRPVADPGVFPVINPPTMTSEVKVAVMVTQTPIPFDDSTPTPTPFDLRATFTPTPIAEIFTPTPFTSPLGANLSDLGLDVVTYRDEWAGFAFEYPAGWELTAPAEEVKANSTGYTATFLSREVVRGPKQQEGIPGNVAKLDVSVMKNEGPTVEAAVDRRRGQLTGPDSGVKLLAEETITLPGGLQAVRFHMDSGSGPAVELVTAINGNMILVDGVGDLSLFNPISESLRVVE